MAVGVQWLRPFPSTTGGVGSSLVRELRSHVSNGQNNKKKKKGMKSNLKFLTKGQLFLIAFRKITLVAAGQEVTCNFLQGYKWP